MGKILSFFLVLAVLNIFGLDRKFPKDCSVINVKDYNVKGDGSTQDRIAIQNLISKYIGQNRFLYFPNGIYRIDGTLSWTKSNGIKDCGLTLIGESRLGTKLRLDNNTVGFTLPGTEKPVLDVYSQTNSKSEMNSIVEGNPSANDGLGNSAFRNAIQNMTIEVGSGNPGAIAIAFMANNIGHIQDVSIISTDPFKKGRCGIDMNRGEPGPLLIKNVSISGFDYGMRVDGKGASLTLENISLSNQNILGIQNFQNTMIIRNLISNNFVPVIKNILGGVSDFPNEGMVSLIDCQFLGGSSSAVSIENEGSFFIRNLTTTGYFAAIKDRGQVVPGTSQFEYTTAWKSHNPLNKSKFSLFECPLNSLDLPVNETPEYFNLNSADWAIVANDLNPNADDCVAIRSAFNSGKSTVFFPSGTYTCSETIVVTGSVRHILGDGAILGVHDFPDPLNRRPFLDISGLNGNLLIENIDFDENAYPNGPQVNPGLVYIRHSSPKSLTLSGVRFRGNENKAMVYESIPGAGNLFIEDVVCHAAPTWTFSPGQFVWARQFNPEGQGLKIDNNGANVWILGLKTENQGTICLTHNGGRTELLGGMLVPTNPVSPTEPAFIVDGAAVSLTYGAYNPRPNLYPNAWYEIQVKETKLGVTKSLLVGDIVDLNNNYPRNMQLPLYVSKSGWSAPLVLKGIETNVTQLVGSPTYVTKFTFEQGNGSGTVRLNSTSLKSLLQTQKSLFKALKAAKRVRVNSTFGLDATSVLICKDAVDCPIPEN